MVIAFDDDIPDEIAERFDALSQRYEALRAIRDQRALADAAEAVYREAAEIEYPQLMVMALSQRYFAQWELDERRESLATYARINRIVSEHRAALYSGLAEIARLYVVISLNTLLDLPEVPLATIDALLDTVEGDARTGGDPLDVAFLCRAVAGAQTGDPDVRRWREEWHAALPSSSALPEVSVAALDSIICATFDPQLAFDVLQARAPYDAFTPRDALSLEAHRALRLAVLGRADDAARAAVDIFDRYPRSALQDGDANRYLLRALGTSRPDLSDEVLGWMADSLRADADPVELEDQAAAAAYLLSADATAERGRELRDLALRNAARYDARNGNTFVSDQLRRDYLGE